MSCFFEARKNDFISYIYIFKEIKNANAKLSFKYP